MTAPASHWTDWVETPEPVLPSPVTPAQVVSYQHATVERLGHEVSLTVLRHRMALGGDPVKLQQIRDGMHAQLYTLRSAIDALLHMTGGIDE